MLIDVTIPQLGESVTEGTISKWLVKEGDTIEKDQPLVSIATDKADSELPAPASGRVAKLLASEGQVVPVKSVIAQIDDTPQSREATTRPKSSQVEVPPPPRLHDTSGAPQAASPQA